MINSSQYFVLHNTCKAVKGLKRSTITDYSRGVSYFIPNVYFDLLNSLDRNKLDSIKSTIEGDESKQYFDEFVSFLSEKELGFLTENIESFPKTSEVYHELPSFIDNMIIEIDSELKVLTYLDKLCLELNSLMCSALQIRIVSEIPKNDILKILSKISTSNINYIEIHLSESYLNIEELKTLVRDYSKVGEIFVYNSTDLQQIDVFGEYNVVKLSLGKIYFINYSFDNGNCCGIINKSNLSFDSLTTHYRIKENNGCLYKKVTIDRDGIIKNCPSMKGQYGNIQNNSIKETITTEDFKKVWNITKDQIAICKFCEFRYSCTDCRAFIDDSDDILSKPAKCKYNPSTCEWEN